jgi:hypothetical protein
MSTPMAEVSDLPISSLYIVNKMILMLQDGGHLGAVHLGHGEVEQNGSGFRR